MGRRISVFLSYRRVLIIAVTVGFLPTMWWGVRRYRDRRHLWRSTVLYACVAVPVGLVLALVTKYVSGVNPLFWLLLYAVAMIPAGLAYAMVRTRHGEGALWAATLSYLVAVSTLLISAVLLA